MWLLERSTFLSQIIQFSLFYLICNVTPGNSAKSEKDSFFVVTALFNPASFQKRYDLYHNFARHMNETGAQLITIECIFPSLNQHEFQVTNSNNSNHIQLKSKSIYWLKENLINIAVERLPAHAKWVSWLDADIVFHDKNWIDLTIHALKNYTVVQIFETAEFLGPQKEVLRTDYSFGYSVAIGKTINPLRYPEWYPHPGYGWAMGVDAFRQMNGLPDFDIVGSGDVHFAYSLINQVPSAINKTLNPDFKAQIYQKSREAYQTLNEISRPQNKLVIGYVPVKISHQWHGSRKDRQYGDRWNILISHNYSFAKDVMKTPEGLFLLKNLPTNFTNTLQEDIRLYFETRNEEETTVKSEDIQSSIQKRNYQLHQQQLQMSRNSSMHNASDVQKCSSANFNLLVGKCLQYCCRNTTASVTVKVLPFIMSASFRHQTYCD